MVGLQSFHGNWEVGSVSGFFFAFVYLIEGHVISRFEGLAVVVAAVDGVRRRRVVLLLPPVGATDARRRSYR